MKTPQLFCCALIIITSCVFTYVAQGFASQLIGYMIVIISMGIFSRNLIAKMDQGSRG